MTEHSRSLVGYGFPTSAAVKQMAARIGRASPINRTVDGTVVRPYVIPWTAPVDKWGVSFPGGIVGLVQSVQLPSSPTAYNADMSARWMDPANSVVTAVPAVLPSAYTLRLKRDWFSAANPLGRIRTANGYSTQLWLPPTGLSFGHAYTITGMGAGPRTFGPGPGFSADYWQTVSPTIGCRKMQVRAGSAFTGSGGGSGTSCYIRVSHNADGSTSINTVPPYTGSADAAITDGTVTFNSNDQTNFDVAANGTSYYFTPWMDIGAVLPVEGVFTSFTLRFHVDATIDGSGNSNIVGNTVDFRISARCDIPYPFTATGQDDLIAPGGTI